ncbi:N-acetyltransferase [Sphingomonas sp. CGMCC 1.13654]|uniref:N-acetyltransferase n=1 Tax=Sphingomonas chungangi TaxID=2683589 RepID=A0A838L3E7_9SPHN|nr:N-acetyltransferase [Sphingomonas chungangi]MBA2933450.1 N-acetyltransferase [Sphingomonas chungangi]MVW54783.1 N-acetyltransferase [Sphingomonas chungangi]
MAGAIEIFHVKTVADKKRFVEVQFALNKADPAWVPPLKMDALELLTPGKNPWFEHGHGDLFIAVRDGRDVGRISAHIDHLWLDMPAEQGGGRDIGNWGLFEAVDQEVANVLIGHAEDWLRKEGMTKAVGPISISIWDEPGLLIKGHDHSPTVMMGHHSPKYEAWIEAAGYAGIKDLNTYELDITKPFPPLIQRIVSSGERNPRITIRKVDKSKFKQEAELILSILNDAWSDNWGFLPITDAEINYVGKKLKPIVFNELIRIAEVEGEPVAFMMTWPDLNEMQKDLNGNLFPFGVVKLLWRLNGGFSGKPKVRTMRVPLMGVKKKLQATRLASQLAFMMIEYIRKDSVELFGASRGEIGWILEDNQGMVSIADAIESHINKVYRIYGKAL